MARSASRNTRRTIFPVVVIGSEFDELDVARHLMPGHMLADKTADLVDQLLARGKSVFQNHERLDRFRAHRIGHADHRRQYDGRMPDQCVLDLGRTDAITAAGDDIVGAALKPEIAVVIAHSEIAGDQPAIGVFVAGRLRVAPVFKHHHRIGTADRNMAGGSGRLLVAVIVDDGGDMAGNGAPHRTGLDWHDAGVGTDHEVALGLAEHFVDGQL